MSTSRTILMIIIAVYLIALGFLIPEINKVIGPNNQVGYNVDNKNLPEDNTEFNLVTSITNLPLWFNTIFIILPFVIFVILGIIALIPTVNAGA